MASQPKSVEDLIYRGDPSRRNEYGFDPEVHKLVNFLTSSGLSQSNWQSILASSNPIASMQSAAQTIANSPNLASNLQASGGFGGSNSSQATATLIQNQFGSASSGTSGGQNMAAPNLPAGWGVAGGAYDSPEEKIRWFNANSVTPDQLKAAGVPQSDIDWMKTQGYTGTTPQQQAAKIGKTLPSDWGVAGGAYDEAAEKIRYFNAQNISADQLRQAGVSQSDIDWMKGQGYTGVAPTSVSATTTTIPASQSTLSPNFSPFVYDMLAKGQAAANLPFQAFTGTRFAGPSDLQKQAFEGLKSLTLPGQYQTATDYAKQVFDKASGMSFTPTTFNTGLGSLKSVEEYMSPYQSAVTDITAREMRRQADVAREQEQSRLAQAGAYGGSRQAIMEAERQRNLQQQLEDVTTKGLQSAYDRAVNQRLAESGLGLQAQQGSEQSKQFGANFGLQALQPMLNASSTISNIGAQQAGTQLQNLQAQLMGGQTQQQLSQQPLDFGFQQWQDSVKFPYQQATYMQSLLGGLPLQAAPYSSTQGQSPMWSALSGGLAGLGLWQALQPK